jgi:hypothetical protein
MKFFYTLFFTLVTLSIFAQTYNLGWTSFPQPLQNATLIEMCDTTKVMLDLFNTSTSEEDFPFTITRHGTATMEDVWTNIEETLTVDFINPTQEILIFPYLDEEVDTGKELIIKVESALGEVKFWTIYLYDDFEEFEILDNIWNGSNTIICSNTFGFDLSIEQASEEIDNYNNEYFYQWESGLANAVGPYVYIGIDGEFYIDDDTVSVEVSALNCSKTIYRVFPQGYDITLDTMACYSIVPVEFEGEYFLNYNNYIISTKRLDLVAENGCDSIVRLNVHWLANETRTEVVYKNPDEIIDFNGMFITEYGNYTNYEQTWQGCDSNHLLTVLPIETQSNLTYLPDSITTSTISCINETCLPIYLPNLEDYTFSLDGEIVNPVFTNDCQMTFPAQWGGSVGHFFEDGSGNLGIDFVVYNNDSLWIDFNYSNS